MKHFYIRGPKNSGTSKIATLIGKEYAAFHSDASILIYRDENKINMDNHEIHDFIPIWDEMIIESVESVGYLDYLDLKYSDDSIKLSKEAFYESLRKFFKSYELVIINSNDFKFDDSFEDKSPMLIVIEPSEKSLAELTHINWSDRAHLVLNKYNSDSVPANIRDEIAEIDLRLIAKFEDFTSEHPGNLQNVHKIMHSLDLIPGDVAL